MRKSRGAKVAPLLGPWILRSASGSEQATLEKPREFAAALRKAMSEAQDIEVLFAIWEHNVETVRALNRSLRQEHLRIRHRGAAGRPSQAMRCRPC